MKESWKVTEVWHSDRPGGVTGEDVASVEGPGLTEPCSEVEVWHHEDSL